MKMFNRSLAACAATAMTFFAVPFQSYAAAVQAAHTITEIRLLDINPRLIAGYVPVYTAALSESSSRQMTVQNEIWRDITTGNEISRRGNEPVPVPDEGEEPLYAYHIALSAAEGYSFSDSFRLYYNDEEISMMHYDAETDAGTCTLRCDFFDLVSPAAEPIAIKTVSVTDALLSFSAGDTPEFGGQAEYPAFYSLVCEGWMGSGKRVRSIADLNTPDDLEGDALLRSFAPGESYSYYVWLQPAGGYRFADDLRLLVNNEQVSYHKNVMQAWIEYQTDLTLTIPQQTTTAVSDTTTMPLSTTAIQTTMSEVTRSVTTTAAMTAKSETTTTAAETAAPLPTDVIAGDLNGDGAITMSDLVLLIRFLAEDSCSGLADYGADAADLNGDGLVTLQDAKLLMRQIMLLPEPAAEAVPKNLLGRADPDAELPHYQMVPPPSEGNSAPFTVQPLAGLTVSAEENALDRDGQLQFSALSTDEETALRQQAEEEGLLYAGGWHVDGGLDADDFLPGSFRSALDLEVFGIPEALYDSVQVMRCDENGMLKTYDTQLDGHTLKWDSTQNSRIFVCIRQSDLESLNISSQMLAAAGEITAGGTVSRPMKNQDLDTLWEKNEIQQLCCDNSGGFRIWYADADAAERNLRMKAAVEKAVRQAKSGEQTVAEILQQNEQYLQDVSAQRNVPTDILQLEGALRLAASDLQAMGFVGTGYIVDVYFSVTSDLAGLRSSAANALRGVCDNPYVILQRGGSGTDLRAAAREAFCGIYQAQYFDASAERHIKFKAMADALISGKKGEAYETYHLGMDDHKASVQILRAEGVLLADFIRFLSGGNNIGQKELYWYYRNCRYSISRTIQSYFGIKEPSVLSDEWESYLIRCEKEIGNRIAKIGGKTSDSDELFGSQLTQLQFRQNGEPLRRRIPVKPFSCSSIRCSSLYTDEWAALWVPDNGFSASMKACSILTLEDSSVGAEWQETKNGLGISVNDTAFGFAIQQGEGNACASGYTLYEIPKPAKPTIQYVKNDVDAAHYELKLNSSGGSAAAAGKTDCFLVRAFAGTKQVYQLKVPFKKWTDKIVIWVSDIRGVPKNYQGDIVITVCEYIEPGAGCTAFYGPQSDAFKMPQHDPSQDMVEGTTRPSSGGSGSGSDVPSSGGGGGGGGGMTSTTMNTTTTAVTTTSAAKTTTTPRATTAVTTPRVTTALNTTTSTTTTTTTTPTTTTTIKTTTSTTTTTSATTSTTSTNTSTEPAVTTNTTAITTVTTTTTSTGVTSTTAITSTDVTSTTAITSTDVTSTTDTSPTDVTATMTATDVTETVVTGTNPPGGQSGTDPTDSDNPFSGDFVIRDEEESDHPDPFDDRPIYIDPTKTVSGEELDAPPINVDALIGDSDGEDQEKASDMPTGPYGNNDVDVKTDSGSNPGDDSGGDPGGDSGGDPGGNPGGKSDLETYHIDHSNSA